MMLPDMCQNPHDFLEEEDVNPEYQRMQLELREDKKKQAEEAKLKAEAEGKEGKKDDE